MKEPIEFRKPTAKPARAGRGRAARTARTVLPKVPGGKALARIHLFRLQRSLDGQQANGSLQRPVAATHLCGLRQLTPLTRGARRRPTRHAGLSPYLAAFRAMTTSAAPIASAAAPIVPASWRPLGPFSIPHGQTYGEGANSRPSVAGRISAVAIAPDDPEHLLIGAAGGGVWESNDAGETWTPRTDDQPSLSIGAVVFDPTDSSIAYAGTGEGDSRSPLGVGLLRSTNGGRDWALHATQPFEGGSFFDLLIDPTDSDHILAATTEGLFRSTNGGTTWQQRRSDMTYDLSMRVAADNSREFLAACRDGLFRSTTGNSWTEVSLPGEPSQFGRLEVVHAPSEGSIAFAFGGNELSDGSITRGFLWRRGTASGAFEKVTLPSDLDVGQAWYDWFAAVAPNNPDVIYLGAINVHKGVRSALGSWSWTNISARDVGDSIHPDQHAIAFNPADSNDLIIGNDGGVYRSIDGGNSWRSLNKGLNITEFEYLAQHPEHESWLLAGTQDNGTLRYQNQQVWYLSRDGDGGDCGVNFSSPHTCYHSFFGMFLERSTKGGAWNTWTNTQLPAPSNDEGLFYPPVEVNGNTVAKAGESVYVSRSKGSPGTWSVIGIPGPAVATALAIPKTTQIYVATHLGDIFETKFASGSWSAPTALTRPRNGFVSDIIVDPTDANRIWVTYSTMSGGHVFRSDDGGSSWSDVSAGLPAIPVNAIEIDPANPDTVFVAADVGVHRTDDAGANWAPFRRNLPNALVHDLVFHAESRLLRAATQSRGVWEINVDAATQSAVDIYIRDNVLDNGRLSPSPSNVDDPFDTGQKVFWWESPDIKIDAPTFQMPAIEAMDFETFEDDQSMQDGGIEFAEGLFNESPQPGQSVRVFVQVHNRGVQAASNVDVRVFATEASATFPNLPTNFWNNFPNNTVPASSPWQPIGPHKTIATIEPGRSRVIGFEWGLPVTFTDKVTLLAFSSAANDSISTTERTIDELVPNEKRCALKSVLVVNPPAPSGPTHSIIRLRVPSRSQKPLTLLTSGKNKLIRGVILPKEVVRKNRRALSRVELGKEDEEELQRLIESNGKLADKLDLRYAYTNKKKGKAAALLPSLNASSLPDDSLVVLLNRKPSAGNQTLVIADEDGTPIGGFTFQARKQK